MHYFILGASGFIGSELVKALLEKGHEVTAFEHRSKIEIVHSNLYVVKSSLENTVPFLTQYKADVVIHLARISGGRYAIGRYLNSLRAKRFNQHIRAWLGTNEQTRLYYISGSLMYGNDEKPITEKKQLNPLSFAREYHIAEKPFVENPPTNITVLRPGWVFGNGSWFKQFFLNVAEKTGKVPQYGTGNNTMSIIHLRDLARLIVAYTEKNPSGPVFNLCSPIQVPAKSFSEKFSQLAQKPLSHLTAKEVQQRYNKTVMEAFTSNILLDTDYKAIIREFKFEYPDLEALLLSEIK